MTFSLKLTKLKAILDFPSYNLPYWLGNKFRGGFGNVLLKAVCGYLHPSCRSCSSREDCLYYALYIREKQKRGKSQPVRPIVFIPPFFGKAVKGRGEMEVEINIFGDYIKYLPHVIYGLRYLGKLGLNSESRYELVSITDYFSGREVYDGESVKISGVKTVDLSEIKPDRVNKELKIDYYTPIEARTPVDLCFLIHMVRRRLILYINEYGNGTAPDYECKAEITESSWNRHRLIHYSKRHGRRTFYGVTGVAAYTISYMDETAAKLLSIGELIGAGAKSSFGMGFYKIMSTQDMSA